MLLGKQIVLQDSADDDSVNGNDMAKLPEDPSREELRVGRDVEENNSQEDTVISDSAPHAYKDRKREFAGRKAPLTKVVRGRMIGDESSPIMLEAPVQKPSSSREKTPIYPGGVHRDERSVGCLCFLISIVNLCNLLISFLGSSYTFRSLVLLVHLSTIYYYN